MPEYLWMPTYINHWLSHVQNLMTETFVTFGITENYLWLDAWKYYHVTSFIFNFFTCSVKQNKSIYKTEDSFKYIPLYALCGFNGIHEPGGTYSCQKFIISFLNFLPLQNHEKCIWNKQITGFKLCIHCGLQMNKRHMNIQRADRILLFTHAALKCETLTQ